MPRKDDGSVDIKDSTGLLKSQNHGGKLNTYLSISTISNPDQLYTKKNWRRASEEILKSKSSSSHKYAILGCLMLGNFCVGSMCSLHAPFLPKLAESKNINSTGYGFIFSIYDVGVTIFSPFVGKLLTRFSARFLIFTGLVLTSVTCILFGILEWSPPGTTFALSAFAIRAVESVGAAAFLTTSYTVIVSCFTEDVGRYFANLETCYGLGITVGPAIGGFLYEVDGFYFPFLIYGGATLFTAIMNYVFAPSKEKIQNPEGTNARKLLSHYGILLNLMVAVSGLILIGFNDATLEPHIRSFTDIPASKVGLIFLSCGLMYAVSNQFWGVVLDKISRGYIVTIFGAVTGIAAFTFLGPAYFIPVPPSITLVVVGQLLLGTASGAQMMASFSQTLKEALRCGFPDDISTYAMVSGVYASAYSLGSAAGPPIGGIILDYIGYRVGCVIMAGIQCLMLIVYLIYLFTRRMDGANYHQDGRIDRC